jgi:multimeric flavodoxin WrbA
MKILHIVGSPKVNSTSTAIAYRFCEKASQANAMIDTFFLNTLNFKGCQGCFKCKQGKDRCAIKDDLTPVLDKLYYADVLLISTPVYFWDLPGELKCFIDRLFSFAKDDWQDNIEPSRLPKGKQLVFIQSQGSIESNHTDIFEKYASLFKSFNGFAECHQIRACNNISSKEIDKHKEILVYTEELARQLVASEKSRH